MRRIAVITATAAFAATAVLPAAADGPGQRWRNDYPHAHGSYEDMMEMMHGHGGMMGGGYGGPGMMGGGMPDGMAHFGMTGGLFDDADADGDGVVTLEEARAAHEAKLAEFDADGDGTLSIDEFEKLHTAAIRELMVDRFQYLDADGDGRVTQEEMNAPIDRMSRYMRMQERYGPGMGRGYDEDDDRPRLRMDDDDAPRRGMDEDDMPGMRGGGMMRE